MLYYNEGSTWLQDPNYLTGQRDPVSLGDMMAHAYGGNHIKLRGFKWDLAGILLQPDFEP
jgi:hypothetical protein